jgi:starch synthase (maltosyl-transferring)
VIENVTPAIDGGRYPVKRVVGDLCRVEADIFKDGHGLLAARICYRGPGDRGWSTAPLEYRYDPDRWYGAFPLDHIGRWQFTVEAWPDRVGSWQADLEKWHAAGEDVRSELPEGAALLRRAARGRRGKAVRLLFDTAAVLADPSIDLDTRLAKALARELRDAAPGPVDREDLARYEKVLDVVVDRERAVFGAWYEMFPRSQSSVAKRHGTFADAERRLPELAELGFDVIYLAPIHPIARTNRKGKNNALVAGPEDPGSPWQIGSEQGGHTAVHPELGTLDDFKHFVRAAKSLGLEVALDNAFQCSPDHPWVKEHPGWFYRRPGGTIRYAENPPKRYQDIYPLNFWCEDREALWNACRDVFRFWIEQGIRIFRVDNPHTKPFCFWEWLIDEIKRESPDVIFLSEAFTRPKRMRALAKLGFTQSYTYFTWKNTGWELREFLTELTQREVIEYFRPNFFANTPDILHEYLQSGGRAAFRVRLLLAATLSPSYGIYSGFELCENVPLRPGSEEYLDSEKYEIRTRDWNAPGHIKEDIALLNRIRRENAALRELANLTLLESSNPEVFCYLKSAPGNVLLVAVNLDPRRPQDTTIRAPHSAFGLPGGAFEVEDLLTGERYTWRGESHYVRLDPAVKVGHILRRPSPAAPATR